MKKLLFKKETDGRWYVDLPEWTGSKADLEMVAGADTLLNYIAQGKAEAWMYISEQPFDNCDTMKFVRMADEIGNGAFYFMEKYNGVTIDLYLWLCNVVLFIFEKFPENFHIAPANID